MIHEDQLIAFFHAITLGDLSPCVEMRVFNADYARSTIVAAEQYRKTFAGWFDEIHALLAEAARVKEVSCYVTLNPVDRILLSRTHNTLKKARKDEATSDDDIACLRWLYLDADPVRKPDIPATQAEMVAALDRLAQVRVDHPALAASSIWGCSGNGGWMLVRLPDWPNDAEHRAKVARFLDSVAAKYSDDAVKIDQKTKNPSRVMCLPGTLKCKGTHTPERPWRYASFTSFNEGHPTAVPPFDADAWLEQHGIAVTAPQPTKGGAKAVKPHANGQLNDKAGDHLPAAQDPETRAKVTVAGMQNSVAGNDGHKQLYGVAVTLVNEFGLTFDQAWPIFKDWNDSKAIPPETEQKIAHILEDAIRNFPVPSLKLLKEDRDAYVKAYPLPWVGAPIGDEAGYERPRIKIRPQMHDVVTDAEAALSWELDCYQRINALVMVLHDPTRAKKITRSGFLPHIVPMENPRVRELLSKNADWYIEREGKEDQPPREIDAMPPEWVAGMLMARKSWLNIRPLHAVVESPVMREDGTILDRPGYDRETGILYEPSQVFPPIPENPTREDALEAVGRLLALVDEFPFVTAAHRAAWLAALLTPLARFAIDGPSPLFLFDANKSGTGKSKLIDVISIIATGTDMSRTVYPETDEEMRKRITSVVISGDRLMLLDNIPEHQPFGGASLDAAITGRTWKDRILNKSELSEMPLITVWYATGNNVQIRGDGLRRICYCRILTDLERPEERTGFKHNPLEFHVLNNRPDLVRDGLTALRAFVLAGRPEFDGPGMDFPAWAALIRNGVHWLTGEDCWSNHVELRESNPDVSNNSAVVHGWYELLGQDAGLTAAQALQVVKDNPIQYSRLHDALMEWSRNSDLPSPRQVGNRLKQIRDSVFDGLKMHSKSYLNTLFWSARPVGDGSYGSDGSDPPHSPQRGTQKDPHESSSNDSPF